MNKISTYIACPRCGSGIAQNWLKCRDPDWQYCADCAASRLSALVPSNAQDHRAASAPVHPIVGQQS